MLKRVFLITVLILNCLIINAQEQERLVYYNAGNFKIIGKGFSETESLYDRLPSCLKDTLRPALWKLSKNSAGIAIRFCSNTTTLGVKWETLFVKNMSHMAATGVRGLDLYTLEKDKWQYISTAKPGEKHTKTILISNMDSLDREYLLYLPLYDGVVTLEIGTDAGAKITKPKIPLPQSGNPIVFYGTSITQGGCASRPGMAYPSIIERKMNIETINLGFSGNGLMDWEILEHMLKINASFYIIDCLPNCDIQRVKERGYPFINLLLKEKNKIPVIMVGEVGFTQSYFDFALKDRVNKKNIEWEKIYNRLKDEGNNNLYFFSNDGLIGNDFEGTVDGRHFTDLGFQRFSNKLLEFINGITEHKKFKNEKK